MVFPMLGGILTFVFFVCSLRTNVVFVFLFLSVSPCRPLSSQRHPLLDIDRDLHVQLDFAFWMLAAAYAQVSRENVETASRLFK